MAAITDAAGALLRHVCRDNGIADVLRVDADPNGLVIGKSEPLADDEVLFFSGAPVLRLSAGAAAALAGCTIATEDTPDGPQLTVIPAAGADRAG